jgi:hypothetical protein
VITALDDASGRTRPEAVVTAARRWILVVVIVGYTSLFFGASMKNVLCAV